MSHVRQWLLKILVHFASKNIQIYEEMSIHCLETQNLWQVLFLTFFSPVKEFQLDIEKLVSIVRMRLQLC